MEMASKRKTPSIKDNLKNKDDLKNEDDLKNCPPPHLKEYYLNFFLWHLTSTAMVQLDTKPEMFSGFLAGNGIQHDEYDLRGIVHVHTYRKDNIVMQRRLLQSFTYLPTLNLKAFYGRLMGYKLNFVGDATMYHTYS